MRKRKELEELFLWDAFLKYLQWFLGTYLIRAKFLYLEWSNQRKLTRKLLRCYEMDESYMESEGEREKVWGAGRAGRLPNVKKTSGNYFLTNIYQFQLYDKCVEVKARD